MEILGVIVLEGNDIVRQVLIRMQITSIVGKIDSPTSKAPDQ